MCQAEFLKTVSFTKDPDGNFETHIPLGTYSCELELS